MTWQVLCVCSGSGTTLQVAAPYFSASSFTGLQEPSDGREGLHFTHGKYTMCHPHHCLRIDFTILPAARHQRLAIFVGVQHDWHPHAYHLRVLFINSDREFALLKKKQNHTKRW